MKTCLILPDRYVQTDYVNLHADRRLYHILNIVSFLIGIAIIAVGWLWKGFDSLVALALRGLSGYLLRVLEFAVCAIAYLALHELKHGLFMRLFSGIRAHHGRKGLLLFTYSEVYFCRRDFLIIMLAPVLIFFVAFAVPAVFLEREWFWLFMLLQVINLGGSVGDFYLAGRALRQPKNALFLSVGVSLTVYTEKNDEKHTDSGM